MPTETRTPASADSGSARAARPTTASRAKSRTSFCVCCMVGILLSCLCRRTRETRADIPVWRCMVTHALRNAWSPGADTLRHSGTFDRRRAKEHAARKAIDSPCEGGHSTDACGGALALAPLMRCEPCWARCAVRWRSRPRTSAGRRRPRGDPSMHREACWFPYGCATRPSYRTDGVSLLQTTNIYRTLQTKSTHFCACYSPIALPHWSA